MNTKEIYDAQLNVSNNISTELVSDLVERLSILGPAGYNTETKCIDIEMDRMATVEDDDTIRTILREWLFDMNLGENVYNTLKNNIEFLFNITKTGYPDKVEHIINVYLY